MYVFSIPRPLDALYLSYSVAWSRYVGDRARRSHEAEDAGVANRYGQVAQTFRTAVFSCGSHLRHQTSSTPSSQSLHAHHPLLYVSAVVARMTRARSPSNAVSRPHEEAAASYMISLTP